MQPTTPVVWSPSTRSHRPAAEVFCGVRWPATEVAARVDVLLDALVAAGHPVHRARTHGPDALLRVHDAGLIDWLRTAYAHWHRSGSAAATRSEQVVPYLFASEAMLAGLPASPPTAAHALAGTWCYDTMTPIGAGTAQAALAAVDCALSAVDLVLAGAPAAYALCRPPGHHATPRSYGGSCYLNNAAVAAQALRDAGHRQVAVVDVDAHHGNGTQAVFYRRADVTYGSVHVDPGAGWFPHVVGHPDERGSAPGQGATLNVALPPGSGDAAWVAGVRALVAHAAASGATALVVSLGVDAAADDPESPLLVTSDGYRATGEMLGELGLPTVLVQEGGYHLPTLGPLVVAALAGHAGG